ncbi:MAG: hypothetical protein JJE22_20250 [Bacteroidia bacterium]|nr:hypothetical protein [Bacteroidia bacterium]
MRTSLRVVRLPVLISLLFFISSRSFSQSISTANGKYELGLNIGPSFFLGDLGGNQGKGRTFVKDINFPLTKLMKGLFVSVYPSEWIGFRFAANIGELEAYDSIIDDKGTAERFRKQRNLGFKSNIIEGYIAAEIYPTVILENFAGLETKFRPYGLAGFGVFHFNPKAPYTTLTGSKDWVALKPLHLEGQGFPEYPDRKNYSLTQGEILLGAGFKYYLTDALYVGFEILHRKTFTDYIDDVSTTYIDPYYFDVHLTSDQATIAKQLAYREQFYNPSINRPYINKQRGDPKQNDAYFSGLIRFGWRLNGSNAPNRRSRNQLKCPVFF